MDSKLLAVAKGTVVLALATTLEKPLLAHNSPHEHSHSEQHMMGSLSVAFQTHKNQTGEIASTWASLEKYLDLQEIERHLDQPIDQFYALLAARPESINGERKRVVVIERAPHRNAHTGLVSRLALVVDRNEKFKTVLMPARDTDHLVAAAETSKAPHSETQFTATPENPSPPVANLGPKDRAGRYLYFLLWLACLAILTVIGVTLWLSVRKDAEREHSRRIDR